VEKIVYLYLPRPSRAASLLCTLLIEGSFEWGARKPQYLHEVPKNTLKTSWEDEKHTQNECKRLTSLSTTVCSSNFSFSSFKNNCSEVRSHLRSHKFIIFSTRFECIFTCSTLVSSVVLPSNRAVTGNWDNELSVGVRGGHRPDVSSMSGENLNTLVTKKHTRFECNLFNLGGLWETFNVINPVEFEDPLCFECGWTSFTLVSSVFSGLFHSFRV
jgi:hypothetical protein